MSESAPHVVAVKLRDAANDTAAQELGVTAGTVMVPNGAVQFDWVSYCTYNVR